MASWPEAGRHARVPGGQGEAGCCCLSWWSYRQGTVSVHLVNFLTVLKSVADPDSASRIQCLFWPLDPGWVEKQDPNPGWTSHFRELGNQFFAVKILELFDADPGWKTFRSGINILNGFTSVGASVADPGCLSRIPDPDFYPSRIPDLGFRIPDPKTATKERWKKLVVIPFYVATNFTKL